MDLGEYRPMPGRKSEKIWEYLCTLTISSYSALEELFLFLYIHRGKSRGKKYEKKKEASHPRHASLCIYVCPFSMACTFSDKVMGK